MNLLSITITVTGLLTFSGLMPDLFSGRKPDKEAIFGARILLNSAFFFKKIDA